MAETTNIDFTALGVPSTPASRYADAFRVGQDLGRASVPPAAPAPGVAAPASPPGTNGEGLGLQARLDAAPLQQRAAAIAQAQHTNEALAHVLIGLKAYPPEQRLGIAQHLAQQTGLFDARAISPDDVSDAGIDAHLATAMSVEQFLKQQGRRAALATEPPPHWRTMVGGPDPIGAGPPTDAQLRSQLGISNG